MSGWKVLSARITAFLLPSPSASPLDIYTRVWNRQPDNFNRSENALAPSLASGKIIGASVNCTVLPGRVDLNIAPPVTQGVQGSIHLIDDAQAVSVELERIANQFGSDLGIPTLRVALGVQLAHPASGFAEANSIISRTLPSNMNLSLTDQEDFALQLNTPYTSSVRQSIRMHLLTKWAVQRFQTIVLSIASPLQAQQLTGAVASFMPSAIEHQIPTISVEANNVVTKIISSSPPSPLDNETQQGLLLEAFGKTQSAFRAMDITDAI